MPFVRNPTGAKKCSFNFQKYNTRSPKGFSLKVRGISEVKANEGPLQGIKVLDLSRILAGPFCSMLLGDMGAEVYKVEHPIGGDDTRYYEKK